MHEVLSTDIAQTGAIGAVTVMLAGLFGVFVKAMGDAARRSDASAEARVMAANRDRDSARDAARYWRELYLTGRAPADMPEPPDDA